MTKPNSDRASADSRLGAPGINFPPPLARGSEFPPPVLSMLASRVNDDCDEPRPLPTDTSERLPVAWARNGLALIARSLPAARRHILLPAYHCPALVEPFIWAGWNITFYPMAPDLGPDASFLDSNLAEEDTILTVPFFGHTATSRAPLQLARRRGCLVIEDLAHAAFKNTLDGDFAVTSLQKFYPVSSGAEILISDRPHSQAAAQKLHSTWRSTMTSQASWALRSLSGRMAAKVSGKKTANPAEASFRYFDPAAIGEPMRKKDQHILRTQDTNRIRIRRRHCYEFLSAELQKCSLGKVLYPELEPGDTPYVFPFLLHSDESFRAIRSAALPLYRWEEIADSGCEVSAQYRSRLVQLPCHQDLSNADLELIVSRLRHIE